MLDFLFGAAVVGGIAWWTYPRREHSAEDTIVRTVISSMQTSPADWSIREERSYGTHLTYTSNQKLGIVLRNNSFYEPRTFKPNLLNRIKLDFTRSGLHTIKREAEKLAVLTDLNKRLEKIGNVAS